ncbi:hypothetical protein [Pseudomonas brassicacearum]|jgi:hypothetical protein|uniref:Uncharacterized protein n=1 Tax=Pseudomonas brassicacearum subsp. neoaurantiaca TaxID=494916 RepID=A0A7V8ZV88_9PSED|nr:hypothetical protein [Pseudomonas brassicacearum]MBA1380968.1 hypothetical protein [Pseudomonas brassicacearum subsp. neoaurantiaca]
MSSIDAWPPWAAIIATGGWGLLGIVSIAYSFYLKCRYLDAMMNALKNSRYIYLWGPAWRGRGWFGGCVLIISIAGMVVWPRAYIRMGDVSPADIENFPPYLKRLLMIKVTMTIISFTGMIVAALLVKFR